jgi:hypothetical protein
MEIHACATQNDKAIVFFFRNFITSRGEVTIDYVKIGIVLQKYW